MRIYAPAGRVPVAAVRTACLAVRKWNRWTQGQLAVKLGVKRKVIERIEQSDVRTVAVWIVQALQQVDGCPAIPTGKG